MLLAERLEDNRPTRFGADDFLTRQEAAAYLQSKIALGTPGTLNNMMRAGVGPTAHKLGRRVLYRRADLDRWIKQRLQRVSRP